MTNPAVGATQTMMVISERDEQTERMFADAVFRDTQPSASFVTDEAKSRVGRRLPLASLT